MGAIHVARERSRAGEALLAHREKARVAVLERSVEGGARDPGAPDDMRDVEPRVAGLGDDFESRIDETRAVCR
jgi:hypothetical protein